MRGVKSDAGSWYTVRYTHIESSTLFGASTLLRRVQYTLWRTLTAREVSQPRLVNGSISSGLQEVVLRVICRHAIPKSYANLRTSCESIIFVRTCRLALEVITARTMLGKAQSANILGLIGEYSWPNR